MSTRLLPASLALLTLAACSEGGSPAPKSPPPITQTLGVITGTVTGNQLTATFTPMGAQAAVRGGASPQIYGDPTKASVTGQYVNMVDVPGVSRTWTFKVAMHNLLANAAGSTYGGTALDSTGVFLGFTQLPVITIPSPCTGCAVSLPTTMGTANFTAPGQPYYWYPNRTQAAGSPGGADSTTAVMWTFVATPFSGADTVHAFTFQLYVNAQWPAPNQSTWSIAYDGTADSLPDTQAEPRWKKFTSTNSGTLGTSSWSTLGLLTGAANGTQSVYFGRQDSLGTNSGYMDCTLKLNTTSNNNVQAVCGFVEPGTGRMAFIALASNRVGFGNFNEGSGNWTQLGGGLGTTAVTGTSSHRYRLRKYGTDSVVYCIDGVRGRVRAYVTLPLTAVSFRNSSTVFGVDGGAVTNASATWTQVAWTIGTPGPGC